MKSSMRSRSGKGKGRERTKYTKKELNQLKEYGQLDPTNLQGAENDLEEAISKAINRRESNRIATFVPTTSKKFKSDKSEDSKGKNQFYSGNVHDQADEKSEEEQAQTFKKTAHDSYKRLLDRFKATAQTFQTQLEKLETTKPERKGKALEILENHSSNSKSNSEENSVGPDTQDNQENDSKQGLKLKPISNPKKSSKTLEENDSLSEQSDSESEDVVNTKKKSNNEDDSNGIGSSIDPFIKHLESHNDIQLAEKISKITNKTCIISEIESGLPEHSAVLYSTVDSEADKIQKLISKPVDITKEQVKHRIVDNFVKTNIKITKSNLHDGNMSNLQQRFFRYLNTYKDVLYGDRSYLNYKELMSIYALHTLNHVLKSRDRIVKHSIKTSKAGQEDSSAGVDVRDQGFTRPTVLILLPYRSQAYEFVSVILKFLGPQKIASLLWTTITYKTLKCPCIIVNLDRFESEFGNDDESEEANSAQSKSKKPDDHKAIFTGNIDDSFRIGIRLTRKSAKLYSDFYLSDILVASPIGLRLLTGSENKETKVDFDFLSSIEILVLDQCDAFQMQNWDHILHLFTRLNLVPKKPRDADFSRIRSYYLDGLMKNLRQTVVISDYITPELSSIFNKYCTSYEGKLRIKANYKGSITRVLSTSLEMAFNKILPKSIMSSNDDRFTYFIEKVLPYISGDGTMIFIPSYFDYVRVRNYVKRESSLAAGFLCEYTPKPDVSRERTWFFHGRHKVILYTERFHYYYRYQLRGIKKIIFYGLPEHPNYFPELINSIDQNAVNEKLADPNKNKPLMNILPSDGSNKAKELPQCLALFTKYDFMKLERVIGTKVVDKLVNSGNISFSFNSSI